jgi:hypothetical protein
MTEPTTQAAPSGTVRADVRPVPGSRWMHDRFGAVNIVCHWGPTACKVKAVNGVRAVVFDYNLHRPNNQISNQSHITEAAP